MKSFEQIAESMYEAFQKERNKTTNVQWTPLAECPTEFKDCWIAAARAAHEQFACAFMEVS